MVTSSVRCRRFMLRSYEKKWKYRKLSFFFRFFVLSSSRRRASSSKKNKWDVSVRFMKMRLNSSIISWMRLNESCRMHRQTLLMSYTRKNVKKRQQIVHDSRKSVTFVKDILSEQK